MEDFYDLEEEDFDLADENELISRYENMVRNHQPAYFSEDDFEELYFYYMDFYIDSFPVQADNLQKGGAIIKVAIAQYPDSKILKLLQIYHAYKERRTSKKATMDRLAKISFPDYEQEHFRHVLAHIYCQMGERKKAISLLKYLLEHTDDEDYMLALHYEILLLYESAEDVPQAVTCCNDILKFGIIGKNLVFTDMYWHYLLKPIAIPVFEVLAAQYTFSMDAWLYLGKSYFDLMMVEKAIQAFKYAAAVSNHPLPLVSLGRLYVITGKIPEALECFYEAIQLDPNRVGLYTEMGEILYNANDAEQAVGFFLKALDADKKDTNAMFGMALALASLERYDDSVSYIMRAKKIDELPIEAWLLLADDYVELNRDNEALEIFEQLVKQHPKDVDVWLSYSNYYAVIEDFEQACAIVNQGLEVLPDNAFLLYRIANYYFLGQYTWRGMAYLRLAYHAEPELLDFFVGYDEEVMTIPEVLEIVSNETMND